jgi:hypothetical protein
MKNKWELVPERKHLRQQKTLRIIKEESVEINHSSVDSCGN